MATERIVIVVQERGTRIVNRRLRDVGNTATGVGKALQFLRRALVVVASAVVLNRLAGFVDRLTQIENRLRLVTASVRELNSVSGQLLNISNNTRTAFDANAEVFTRVSLATRDLGRSQNETLQFVDRLNKAIIISGASAQEAAAGIIQLTQGLASDRLSGDELRSVLEQLPRVAQVIADGLGVTRGELRKLGEDGKITADVILDAFDRVGDSLDREFAKTVPTISQSLQVLRNNLIDVIGRINEKTLVLTALSKAILAVSSVLPQLIILLGGLGIALLVANFSVLAKIIQVVAVRLNVKLGQALGSTTLKMRALHLESARLNATMSQLGSKGILPLTGRLGLLAKAAVSSPFVLLGGVLLTVGTVLFGLRNRINASVDGMTSLGDVTEVAGRRIGGVWDNVTEGIGLAFSGVYDEVTDQLDDFTGAYIPRLAKGFDEFAGDVRDIFKDLFFDPRRPLDQPVTFFQDILGEASRLRAEREAELAAAREAAREKEVRLAQEYLSELEKETRILKLNGRERDVQVEYLKAERELKRQGVDLSNSENSELREQVRQRLRVLQIISATAEAIDRANPDPEFGQDVLQQLLTRRAAAVKQLEVLRKEVANPVEFLGGVEFAEDGVRKQEAEIKRLDRAIKLTYQSIEETKISLNSLLEQTKQSFRVEAGLLRRNANERDNYRRAYEDAAAIREQLESVFIRTSDEEFLRTIDTIKALYDQQDAIEQVSLSLDNVTKKTFDFSAAESELNLLLKAGKIDADTYAAALADLRDRLSDLSKTPSDIRISQTNAFAEEVTLARLSSDERERRIAIEDRLAQVVRDYAENNILLTTKELELERQRAEQRVDALRTINIVQEATDDYRSSVVDLSAAKDELIRLTKDETISVDQAAEAYRNLRIKQLEQSRDGADGAERSLLKIQQNATDTAQQLEDFTANAFQGMEDALVKFVTTGEISFEQFANSIIQDLTRIAVQQAIIGPLAGALLGFLNPAGAAAAGALSARALGGPVTGGQPYLVGERGPELFVPPTGGGSIEPNSGQGGGNVRIINVIDPSAMSDYLASPEGERVILNTITKNPSTVRRAAGG